MKAFMNTMAETKQNAYFTLEACLIMPFVFGIIIFLMYMGFYTYNKCLLRQDTYRLLIRGGQVKNASNEEVFNKIKEEESRWYYDKYVICSWENKTIGVERDSINISRNIKMSVSTPFLEGISGGSMWSINIKTEATRVHPIDTIRLCRKAESLLTKENE